MAQEVVLSVETLATHLMKVEWLVVKNISRIDARWANSPHIEMS